MVFSWKKNLSRHVSCTGRHLLLQLTNLSAGSRDLRLWKDHSYGIASFSYSRTITIGFCIHQTHMAWVQGGWTIRLGTNQASQGYGPTISPMWWPHFPPFWWCARYVQGRNSLEHILQGGQWWLLQLLPCHLVLRFGNPSACPVFHHIGMPLVLHDAAEWAPHFYMNPESYLHIIVSLFFILEDW